MASVQDAFTEADALYALRESNPPGIAAARNAYLAILDDQTASPAQKIRAASQLGRLAIYLGEMLTPRSDVAKREQVFFDCWSGFIEKINPAAVGENPAYYYFKGICLAYWVDVVSPAKYYLQISTLIELMNKGCPAGKNGYGEQLYDEDYEGGGMSRLRAFVHGNNRLAAVPIFGFYDPQAALTEINAALARPGEPNEISEETIGGQVYYENWLAQGKVYMEIYDKKADAKNAYVSGIEEIIVNINVGSSPSSRSSESQWVLCALIAELDALG